MDFEAILQRIPSAERGAVQAWWNALPEEHRQRGLQDLSAQYPAPTGRIPVPTLPTPAVDALGMGQPSNTRTSLPMGAVVPGVISTILGGTYASGLVRTPSDIALSNARKAVAETPGGLEALLQSVQQRVQSGRGENIALSDLSPRLAAEGDFVATNHPPTAATFQELNTARNRSRPGRIIADVERIAPGGYADPTGLLEQISKERQNWAAGPQGYGGLRAANPELSNRGANEVLSVINNPRVARAWRDAAAVGAVGPLPEAGVLSFEVIQDLNENLERLATAAYARPGGGSLGARLASAHDELTGALERNVPGYAEVSAKYKRFKQQEQAVQSGMEWWRDPKLQLPELERRLASIPESDRWLVQRGMLGAYLADAENNIQNAGHFERFLTDLPVQQRKLEVAFGGARQAEQALQAFEQERNMIRGAQIGTGSLTSPREARKAAAASEVLGDAAHVLAHPTTGIPMVARRGYSRWLPGAVTGEMAPMFAPKTAPEMEALLRLLARAPK